MAERKNNNGATLGFEETLWQDRGSAAQPLVRKGSLRMQEFGACVAMLQQPGNGLHG